MSDKFVCPFEDALVYEIPGNYAPNYGSGANGWHANASVTHPQNPMLLMDIDNLHYGTPENTFKQVNPNPNKNT